MSKSKKSVKKEIISEPEEIINNEIIETVEEDKPKGRMGWPDSGTVTY